MRKRILKIFAFAGISMLAFSVLIGTAGEAAANPDAGETPVPVTKAVAVIEQTADPDWIVSAFAAHTTAVAKTAMIPSGSAAVPAAVAEMLFSRQIPYVYSDEEIRYIARVVYAEARGEQFEGKVAVAAVVINRFESGRYGKTVKRVVFARNQFAVSGRTSNECITAVKAAIESRGIYPSDMYYFRVSKSKRWRNFEYFDRIGNHSFYCAR